MKILFTAAFGLIVLNGCGGGGGGDNTVSTSNTSTTTSNTSSTENTVNETVTVNVPQCNNVEDYMDDTKKIDVTDKNIKSTGGDAKLRVWLSPDGSEFACTVSGTAILQ